MKKHTIKTTTGILLVMITILFSGCDLLNKADDINFDASLETSISVTEESTGTDVAYNKVVILDATTDGDINKYQNKISGFTIHKISYQIVSFDGTNGATFSGTLSFGDATQTVPTVAATISNLNLQTAYTSGQLFDLSFSQSDVEKIQSLLKANKAVKIYLNGTLSATPLYCVIEVFLDVTVKADAL